MGERETAGIAPSPPAVPALSVADAALAARLRETFGVWGTCSAPCDNEDGKAWERVAAFIRAYGDERACQTWEDAEKLVVGSYKHGKKNMGTHGRMLVEAIRARAEETKNA